jgi:alanine racemase
VRPTYVEIDLTAVSENVARFVEMIAPSEFCVVVKADGYGHGDVPVAETALEAGAKRVAVALVEEGIRLREAGIGAPILVLSEPGPDAAIDVVRWGLTPTVYSPTFVEALIATGVPTAVHLKVDTGMHRVGAAPSAVGDLISAISRAPTLELEALWTHFAVADSDPDFTRLQIERFGEIAGDFAAPMTHLANTAGAILFPEARSSMCRIGLGTYGLHPSQESRAHIQLRPAMRMVSEVVHLQRLAAGERPSYGRVRTLESDSTVAVVPVGYADGFPWGRAGGDVLIGGTRHPLAGRVTMDQVLIDVGDSQVSIGDEVVLLGGQGAEEVTVEEWAADLRTISWEVICTVGPRVPRSYTR